MNCWLVASTLLAILGSIGCPRSREGSSRSLAPLTVEELEAKKQQLLTYSSLVRDRLKTTDETYETHYASEYDEELQKFLNNNNQIDFTNAIQSVLSDAITFLKSTDYDSAKSLLIGLSERMKEGNLWISPYSDNVNMLYRDVFQGPSRRFAPLTAEELEAQKQQVLEYGSLVRGILDSVDQTHSMAYAPKYDEILNTFSDNNNQVDFTIAIGTLLKEFITIFSSLKNLDSKKLLMNLCKNMKKKGIWISPYSDNVTNLYVDVLGGSKKYLKTHCREQADSSSKGGQSSKRRQSSEAGQSSN